MAMQAIYLSNSISIALGVRSLANSWFPECWRSVLRKQARGARKEIHVQITILPIAKN
jgi:hypothetical protein